MHVPSLVVNDAITELGRLRSEVAYLRDVNRALAQAANIRPGNWHHYVKARDELEESTERVRVRLALSMVALSLACGGASLATAIGWHALVWIFIPLTLAAAVGPVVWFVRHMKKWRNLGRLRQSAFKD